MRNNKRESKVSVKPNPADEYTPSSNDTATARAAAQG